MQAQMGCMDTSDEEWRATAHSPQSRHGLAAAGLQSGCNRAATGLQLKAGSSPGLAALSPRSPQGYAMVRYMHMHMLHVHMHMHMHM